MAPKPIKREDVEPMYEEVLIGETRKLVVPAPPEGQPDTRADDALRRAEPFFLTFFGAQFPAAGICILSATGENESRDKRHLPDELHGELRTYYPAQPLKGANSRQEDLTGTAKDITRLVRNRILQKLRGSPIGPYLYVEESVGGDRIGPGIAQVTERSTSTRHIVWVDRTRFSIKVSL